MLEHRYDFVFLFDVTDGNPNGDPDAGNQPRVDPETEHGLVSDVCLKRKLRNRIQLAYGDQTGYDIFIKSGAILNQAIDGCLGERDAATKRSKKDKQDQQERLCQRYYDIRTFGAVLSTGKEGGTSPVCGPVQLSFARSLDPIFAQDHTITRMAVTTEKDADKQQENRTMGEKWTIPYALYRCYGFVSPHFANKSGFNQQDLERLWESFSMLFEDDRSAARGLMVARRLLVFRHQSPLGNCPAHKLFELVKIEKTGQDSPRSYGDYRITIDRQSLPPHVELEDKI